MILKGSQRGGAKQLAAHLLRTDENEHVTLQEVRGFTANDVTGALLEAEAIAKGTRCKQHLFSLSLNPPKDGKASVDDLVAAADEAEKRLGLQGCPRLLITHEKNGRRHAHAVWSRIEPEKLRAVNLPFFKTRLAELSKDLYLQHGWELPEGHKDKTKTNPLNFELPEGQTAKRSGLDPKAVKQLFRHAWKQSEGLKTFRHLLEEKGFFLARGDRRGYVAVDMYGKVYSVARLLGIKTKELNQKLGRPEFSPLPAVEKVRSEIAVATTPVVTQGIRETRRQHRRELTPLRWERRRIVREQRTERVRMSSLNPKAKTTTNRNPPTLTLKDWQQGALQHLSSERPFIRQQQANEPYEAYRRYRRALEDRYEEQLEQLRALQRHIDKVRSRQQAEQLAMIARMALLRRLERDGERNSRESRPHQLTLEL